MKPSIVSPRSDLFAGAASILIALSLHGTTYAASIIWGAPSPISGDSDVRNNGTLVGAYGFSTTSPTINGVTFTNFSEVPGDNQIGNYTLGNFTLGFDSGNFLADAGSNNAPFTSLTANYQNLLSRCVLDVSTADIAMTIQGLTPGQEYLFQWWSNRSDSTLTRDTTANAGNSVTLSDNQGEFFGTLGNYAIGTFTADTATQLISFVSSSSYFPQVNAFQLRAVPEPASAGLLLGTGMMLLMRRYRTRNC